MAAKSGSRLRAVGADGVAEGAAPARSEVNSGCVTPARAVTGVVEAEAVTNVCLLVPANTVTLLSGSIRTCISAPTRLRR